MNFDVRSLTQADVLQLSSTEASDKPGGYVIRRIWQKPVIIDGQNHLHMAITGFTLLDTQSLTDREVTVDDLQQAIDSGTLKPLYPQTVRQVRGLTPKDYHK